MTKAAAPRGRTIAVGLLAALLVVLALSRWTGTNAPSRPAPPTVAAPTPRATVARAAVVSPRNAPERSSISPTPPPTGRAAAARPAPGVFDFGSMTPPARSGDHRDEERFATNERFTREDLQHPERYFEYAERMPELNRPEERRDTLAFFLAYREKLRRDLDAAGENRARRDAILATIERYDAAIARLQTLVDAAGAD